MKKYLKTLAVSALVIPLAFAFTACTGCNENGYNNGKGNGKDNGYDNGGCYTPKPTSPAEHIEFQGAKSGSTAWYPGTEIKSVNKEYHKVSVQVASDIDLVAVNFGSMFKHHEIDTSADGFKFEARAQGADNWLEFTVSPTQIADNPVVLYVYNDTTNWEHKAAYAMVGSPARGYSRTIEFRVTKETAGEVFIITVYIHRMA